MAIKFKVKDGKKYIWDTFANRWSYRGAVPYPVEEGEYKDTLPPPPKGAKVSQAPELSEVLSFPYQAAMAGVTKLGKAISKPAMDIGVGFTQGIKEAAKEQFPQRERDSIYAPTTGEKLMTKGQEIARSVLDVSPPVEKPTQEPKVQINPPIRPASQPSISVAPPTPEEEELTRRHRVMDVTHLDSVLSSIAEKDKARDTIIEKNPWLGGGFSVKLNIPSPTEAAILEHGSVPKAKTGYEGLNPDQVIARYNKRHGTKFGGDKEIGQWAEMEAREFNTQSDGTPVRIASKKEIASIRAQEPEDASKIPVQETPKEKIPPFFREEEEVPTERPRTAKGYADEYNRKYQMALAGRSGTMTRDGGYR